MWDEFDILLALARHKTVSRAAIALGITQPAASKRLALLEAGLKRKLTERSGRYVSLTPFAQQLVTEAAPLVAALRGLADLEAPEEGGELTIGLATAIASSWGPAAVHRAAAQLSGISLELQIDGPPAIVENVRSGNCSLGIFRGTGESAPDLVSEELGREETLLIPSGLRRFPLRRGVDVSVLGIGYSEARKILERKIKRFAKQTGIKLVMSGDYRAWTAVTQMACAGLGHALVPRAMAQAYKLPSRKLIELPQPGITLPVTMVCRRQTRQRRAVTRFLEAFRASIPDGVRS